LRLPRRVRFGLWLNIERAQARSALPIANGIKLANDSQLPASFFAHLTDRDDQAALIAARRGAASGR
jgi:hypothetical protein